MADSPDTLRSVVLEKINKQKARRPDTSGREYAQRLGEFVETSLRAQHLSVKEFARRLDVEVDLAAAILKGELPDSELDDTLLADVAAATGHTFNTVRLLMGKEITPTLSVSRTATPGSTSASAGTGKRPTSRRSRP
jgi:hypothetical protein